MSSASGVQMSLLIHPVTPSGCFALTVGYVSSTYAPIMMGMSRKAASGVKNLNSNASLLRNLQLGEQDEDLLMRLVDEDFAVASDREEQSDHGGQNEQANIMVHD